MLLEAEIATLNTRIQNLEREANDGEANNDELDDLTAQVEGLADFANGLITDVANGLRDVVRLEREVVERKE